MVLASPIFVCTDAVDFRLGIDGLGMLAQAALGPKRALTGSHVFFNRARDKVKILSYDRNGWWLCYKRLERGQFPFVSTETLSEVDLRLLLEGIPLSVKRLPTVAVACIA